MGWWDVCDDPKIVTGDAPLDLVRRFLKDFSKEYQDDLSRKPMLAELEYALNLAFRVNLNDEIVSEFEELEVKQVSLKTAKRPKRAKPKVGDIFAFKIANRDLFGFGRLVSNVSIGMVAEIFDYFSVQPILDPSMMDLWLFSPVILSPYVIFEKKLQGDWRIIGHTEDFKVGRKFDSIRYIYGEAPNNLKAVGVDDKEHNISEREARGHRMFAPFIDANIQHLVSEILKGRD